jgi:hypothetical protein
MVYLDPQQTTNSGYFLGLLQSVENPLISPYDRNQWTSHEGDGCLMEEDSQISGQNEVLSLPNLRVSMDDLVDEQNEEQSEPPVIRSTDCETGECSEQYEQNNENIFSSLKQPDSDEVSSQVTKNIE